MALTNLKNRAHKVKLNKTNTNQDVVNTKSSSKFILLLWILSRKLSDNRKIKLYNEHKLNADVKWLNFILRWVFLLTWHCACLGINNCKIGKFLSQIKMPWNFDDVCYLSAFIWFDEFHLSSIDLTISYVFLLSNCYQCLTVSFTFVWKVFSKENHEKHAFFASKINCSFA